MSISLEVKECPLKHTVEQNTHDITVLKKSIGELTINTNMLLEVHKELREFMRLACEHDFEIESIQQLLKESRETVARIQQQLNMVEQQHLIAHTTQQAHEKLFAALLRYGPTLIAIIVAIVGTVIAIEEWH